MAQHTGREQGFTTDRVGQARRSRRPRAFTLIELMMVLGVVSLLATVAMTMMHDAGDGARAAVYNANRRILQDQVVRFRADHGADPAPDRFREQMTMATNKRGDIAAPGTPGYPYGPYLDKIPVNPYTGGSSVGLAAASDWNLQAISGDPAELSSMSRRHMSELYAAASSYLDERGAFPESLNALRGAYIEEETFQVVIISPRTGHAFSYEAAEAGQSDAVLIQETGGSPTGLLVCYADGRIEEGL